MREPKAAFTELPEPGQTLADSGFTYTVLSSRPHTNRDGASSILIEWRGQCADDGEPFTFKTGKTIYNLPRRCPLHAKGKGWAKVQPFGLPPVPGLTASGESPDVLVRYEAACRQWAKTAEAWIPLTPERAWQELFDILLDIVS